MCIPQLVIPSERLRRSRDDAFSAQSTELFPLIVYPGPYLGYSNETALTDLSVITFNVSINLISGKRGKFATVQARMRSLISVILTLIKTKKKIKVLVNKILYNIPDLTNERYRRFNGRQRLHSGSSHVCKEEENETRYSDFSHNHIVYNEHSHCYIIKSNIY